MIMDSTQITAHEMTDPETRKWAAEFCEITFQNSVSPDANWRGNRRIGEYWIDVTDADLAESVREQFHTSTSHHRVSIRSTDDLMEAWFVGGPLAFIRAVKDVIDD